MTTVQEKVLQEYLPDYEEVKSKICKFSDYELNMVHRLPTEINDLRDWVCDSLQLEIVPSLFKWIIQDFEDFCDDNLDMLEDYCQCNTFLYYNDLSHSYELDFGIIMGICKGLNVKTYDNIDFSKIVFKLNMEFPIKFGIYNDNISNF